MEVKSGREMGAPRISALVRELLSQRGIADDGAIAAFLYPPYETSLADPFLMTDMNKAVKRILQAIKAHEKVAVYGDYDIDGIVSTTLMLEILQQNGLDPITYIPDRYDEGYGIHTSALQELKDQGVTLVISVDCGITSVDEAGWARANGLDLIITDHHDVPAELPKAVAVVNPRQLGDAYPFKDLAGVGVAFAVARALQQRTGIPATGQEKWLLDLVALGTVCDVMPLHGENRVLTKFGLLVLRKTRRVGLVALAQSAGLELSQAKAYHLGFVFGPRLNAAGRLENAAYSLELMLTKDPVEAQALAFQLEEMNHQRRLEQDRIVQEADAIAETYGTDSVLVLADTSWPHGVVGIAASKLAEKWQKPTLILQILGETAKGSGRSAAGYNLIEGLRSRADLFTRLGGHHFAAGFTLPVENLDELRTALNAHYQENSDQLTPRTQREADIEISDPTTINWELYQNLELLEPYGHSNPEPAFGLNKLKVIEATVVGKTKTHLKLKLASEAGTIHEAIGFGLVEKYPNIKPGQVIDVLCYIQKNDFNDRSNLQLVVISVQ
ncbi:MAG TPA: single-stranded-DNA-specific exonuclease RecJ [Candidatus Saccharimonadales bacterium]|nr:single-stranded-DNA-specific exonuclease RecJ [Candidatus Saccharimonadales bacterium]